MLSLFKVSNSGICRCGSLCCRAEIDTTLYLNCTLKKKNSVVFSVLIGTATVITGSFRIFSWPQTPYALAVTPNPPSPHLLPRP